LGALGFEGADPFPQKRLESTKGRLAKLRRITTVSNVQSRFEIIANETDDMDDNRMVRLFISELRDDIKNPVLVHKPKSYEETLNLAHIHEQQIQAEKGPVRLAFARSTPILPTPNSATLNQNPLFLFNALQCLAFLFEPHSS